MAKTLIEKAAANAADYAKSITDRKLREELKRFGLDPDNPAIWSVAKGRLKEELDKQGEHDPEKDLKRACPRGFGRGLCERAAEGDVVKHH